ncbi:asparagine synthetase B [Alkalihalophilus marmarensis]|uniref:asparagine synthetase B family protein n=1 Tax=Alkalihalophilus marmarensis TaxID=521377 RepID=UPI00203B7AB3|nr:asparagine synthetase B [Alkalihalophilus marmarensis]MCM3490026.1 asparagine synthetase B [Alkalihalophilus marmarensis]
MCGIAGIFSCEQGRPEDIFSIINKLRKRGPDGLGLIQNKNYAIGGTRLSITGPETVPIPLFNNNWGIVYNGEIYNIESNPNLTDTQSLLDCLQKNPYSMHYDGMFAYCFFNINDSLAYLTRDSFGIKPLYYLKSNKELRFCSEVFGLKEDLNNNINLSPQLLFEYLSIGRSLEDKTLFKDIYSLPTDKILKLKQNEEFIEYNFIEKVPKAKKNNVTFLEALENSVLKCADTEKPLGLFLSGGIDSTAIAAILAKNKVKGLKTFSLLLGEDGVPSLDVLDLPGESWKTWKHFTLSPDSDDINKAFSKVLDITSEPCFPMSSIYTYLLSEMAAQENIKVILSGEGADELFLGYESYLDFIKKGDSEFVNFYLNKSSTEVIANLIDRGDQGKTVTSQKLYSIAKQEIGLVNKLLAAEKIVSLRPLLDRIDITSMFHAVEIRVPFLHGDVPSIAEEMMNVLDVRHIQETKPLLRNELKLILSQSSVTTPKRPLRLNLKEFFHQNQLEDLFESLNIKEISALLPISDKKLKSFIDKLLNEPTEETLSVAIRLYQICYYITRTGVINNSRVLEEV